MHFGAAVRDVLSTTCGSDLRGARARTVVPALQSPATQRLLAVKLEAAFGVAIPPVDLRHLTTVRDVLQCVRLRRWAARVEERTHAAASRASVQTAPSDVARTGGDDACQGVFRLTRRESGADAARAVAPAPCPTKRL